MNYKLIFRLIGHMLVIQALFMIIPLIVSLRYGEKEYRSFLWTILLLVVLGGVLLYLKPDDKKFKPKDAFAAAGLSWLLLPLFGAVPFFLSGCFDSVVDCIFESVSGFTTTGGTILSNVEILPRGILFWRCFSHWIGGMGVLMFILAVMPSMNASSINLLRAESTGPSPDKVVPKIRETAKIMYLIYLVMTILLIVLLYIAGLPVYDSFVNGFSVAGTGGFSTMSASIAAYNNIAAEIIMTIFMFLFGISFTLYFFIIGKKFIKFISDNELKFYFVIVITSIIVIAINISGIYGGFFEALRHASFQVSSIISTTGFSTTDYNVWPTLSQVILLLLMITGCCAGSTGGGIKLIRILIFFKVLKIEVSKIFHPGSVKVVTVNDKKISHEIVLKTGLFFFVYFVVFIISVMVVSIDNKNIVSTSTAVIASLSNIGPGFDSVGPLGNFSEFSPVSKIVLSFCMIAGRLEFYPLLILFVPSMWKKRNIR